MDDDDDFGFLPGGSSRLSTLFPMQDTNEDVNQSLTYVPPKQPKKTEDHSSSNTGNLNLIHAIAAFTYKLENGQYCNQGKLGAAILGDHETSVYKLLLYKGKRHQVTWCTISINFKFTVEPQNYAKFPDDKGEQWSIKFSSEEQLSQFAKQVALAKANSSGRPPSTLVIQDLVPGESQPADNGDALNIVYTGWLFKNFGFGEVFDENSKCEKPFIVHLGKSNLVKGLCEGLLGAKKSMKRLVIIPSDLGYGSKGLANVVPPDQVLIFEVIINKIKFSKDSAFSPSRNRSESEAKPEVPPRTQSVGEDSIRSRGASISEQLIQSPRKDNAKIISRMAKMGMATLPLQGAIAAHTSSESEPEREPEHEQPSRRSESPKHRIVSNIQREAEQEQLNRQSGDGQAKHMVSSIQSEVQLSEVHHAPRRSISSPRTSSPHLQANSVVFPTYSNPAVQGDSLPFLHQTVQAHPTASFITPVVPSLLESHIPILVSETRTQNTEVRLMLAKISDKLDAVMPKLEEIKSQGSPSKHSQAPFLENSVLAQNIERIIQENTQMKKENEAKTCKINELNEKICDILQRSQGFFEESNSILEQKSDSLQMTTSQLQNKISSLEQEKVKLSAELNETVSALNKMQQQLHEAQELCNALQNKSDSSEGDFNELKELVAVLKAKISEKEQLEISLKDNIEEWKKKSNDLNLELQVAQDKVKAANDQENILKAKLSELSDRPDSSELKEVREQLQAQVDKVHHWKRKYESLHQNAQAMKSGYDAQIETLMSELKILQIRSASQQSTQDFTLEIKKAMTVLYRSLQSEVNDSQMYSGKDVLQLTLDLIRRVTLRLIGVGQQQQVDHSSHKSSSDNSTPKTVEHSSPKSVTDHSSPENSVNCHSESVNASNSDETEEIKPEPHSDPHEIERSEEISSDQERNIPAEVKTEKLDATEERNVSLNHVQTEMHPTVSSSEFCAGVSESEEKVSREAEAQPVQEMKDLVDEVHEEPSKAAVEEKSDGRRSPDHVGDKIFGFNLHSSTQWNIALTMISVLLLAYFLLYLATLVDDMETTATNPSSL